MVGVYLIVCRLICACRYSIVLVSWSREELTLAVFHLDTSPLKTTV